MTLEDRLVEVFEAVDARLHALGLDDTKPRPLD
jgi:hypothetical protein